ncbi:MAG: RDD family protein [bacterium]|nr:RDD family protein [bacterium]
MRTKANIVNRYMAGAVDFGIAVLIYFIFTKSLKINIILANIFVLFRDCLSGGKSIGKMIFNLNTYKLKDESPATFRESILRNFFFIIPIINYLMIAVELFLIYWDPDGSRIGDKIAMTQIVDDDTKLNKEIQETFIEIPEQNEKKEI